MKQRASAKKCGVGGEPPAMVRLHRRIAEKAADRSGRAVTVVALGDSVTQGVAEVDRLLHSTVYHARLKTLLEQSYPLTTFNMLNAGVDGHTATHGQERLERDVICHKPDLVLIAFGLNDAFAGGESGVPAFGRTLDALIDRVRSATPADVILLTPNLMLKRDNDAVPDQYREYLEPFLKIQTLGVLGQYAQQIRDSAHSHGLMVADVYRAWEDVESRGVDTTAMLSNGLNHPTAEAHLLAAREVFSAIHGQGFVPSSKRLV